MTRVLELPSFLKPVYETDLIRVGQKKDGGYLIPKKSLEDTKILYSFGLEADWSFEEDFYNRTKSKIYCYDHTVNWKFFLKLFLGNPKTILKFFQYKKFFDEKDKFHIRKMICPTESYGPSLNENSLADLNSIIKDTTDKKFFLKIDIEGHEYRILDQIRKYSSSINGLAIEFHNCDLHSEKIKNFINNFELQLVHIHVNNWALINSNNFPRVFELIFSPKDFNKKIINDDKKFPTSMDEPNNPLYKDLPIEFNG
tara:strand:+ start:39 stop:803 length:765 start_codon:yes stop_codon:yes gene_type:complete